MPNIGAFALLFCLLIQVNCGANRERKPVIRFLLSDAKSPDFDLKNFQKQSIVEDDSVPSESIILPTLNLESHPYAVVVLPDLNKYTSLNFRGNKFNLKGESSYDRDDNDDNDDIEDEREAPSSTKHFSDHSVSEEKNTPLRDIPDNIRIFPVVRSGTETIDLRKFGQNFDSKNETSFEDEENIQSFNRFDLSDENAEDSAKDEGDSKEESFIQMESDKSTLRESVEETEPDDSFKGASDETNDTQGKSLNNNKRLKIAEASHERKSRVVYEGYPRKGGDLLFSPVQVPVDFESSEEIFTQEDSPFRNSNLSQDKSLIPNNSNINNKQNTPIQTLPIVDQFSLLQNLVPSHNQFKPQELSSVTKNQFLTSAKARDEFLPLSNNRNLKNQQSFEITNESPKSSNERFSSNFQTSKTLLNERNSNENLEHKNKSNSYGKEEKQIFDPLRINDNVDSSPNENNLGKSISDTQSQQSRFPLHKSGTEVLSQESKGNVSSELDGNLTPFILQMLNSNSSAINSSFPTSVFEFVRSIGLPLPIFPKANENGNSTEPLPFNFKVSSSEDPSSAEQSDQIKQLIRLRNQLSLLDTATFLNKNLGKTASQEVNPERSIGSFRVESSGENGTEILESNVKGSKSLSDGSLSKVRTNLNLLSALFDGSSHTSKDDFSVEILESLTNSSTKSQEQQNSSLSSENQDFMNTESKEGTLLNWSNFLRMNDKKTEVQDSTKIRNDAIFNNLESIIAPIKSPLNMNVHQESNANKTFNVVLEKFDVSNVMPPKTNSSFSFDEDVPQDSNEAINILNQQFTDHKTNSSNNEKVPQFRETTEASDKISSLDTVPVGNDEQFLSSDLSLSSFKDQQSIDDNHEDSQSSVGKTNLRTSYDSNTSSRIKFQAVPLPFLDLELAISVRSNDVTTFIPCIGVGCVSNINEMYKPEIKTITERNTLNTLYDPENLRLSVSYEVIQSTPSHTKDCKRNPVECDDVTVISSVTKDVTHSVTSTMFDFVPQTITKPVHVTETVLLKETKKNMIVSTVYPDDEEVTITQTVSITSEIVEPRTVAVVSKEHPLTVITQTQFHKYTKIEPQTVTTILTDLTVTNLVHHASIKPTTIITTSYMIHNVLTLDTVTQLVTVTVMKPSAVFHTETEIIKQTRYVTVTKTLPPRIKYASTVFRVVPKPSKVTVNPVPVTVTRVINSVATVTRTLYPTSCSNYPDDYYSSESYYSQLNNYGINPENLVNNPSYAQSRSHPRKQYVQEREQNFDELYWPKESKFKRDAWPEGFNSDKFVPPSLSFEPEGSFNHYYHPQPQPEAQESSLVRTVSLPDRKEKGSKSKERTSRGRIFDKQPLVYGIPFYGYKPLNYKSPLHTNPGEETPNKVKT